MPLPVATRTDDSVLTIRHDDVANGWEQWYLLLSDAHWDNPHCERATLRRHLDQALEREAVILSFGDFFCAMQGKYDKRASKDDIRPEHTGGNYLDLLVDTATTWLEPYKRNLYMLADGNHEWKIEEKLETSLTQRLADRLDVERMYEWGYVSLLFRSPTKGNKGRRLIYFHHGTGGGGPVTRGLIGTNRKNAMAVADLYVEGHIHERWAVETPKTTCTHSGKAQTTSAWHIRCGGYKDEYKATGWHTKMGRGPKPIGAMWLRFFFDSRKPGRVGLEPIPTD